VVTNIGNEALTAPTPKISIEIDAVDSTTGATTVLKILPNQSVSALGANKSATFTTPVTFPLGMPGGTYYLRAVADSTDVLAGIRNPADETVTTSGTMVVAYGDVDLSGAFGAGISALPIARTSADGKTISVPVVVKNNGNVPAPAGQKITIEIDATRDGGVTTIPLKIVAGESVSSLGVGKSATFTTLVLLPPGMPAGAYNLVATVDSTHTMTTDPNWANNTTALSPTQMNVTTGYVDLSGTFGTSTLPSTIAAGAALTGTVPVILKNTGKVALEPDQTVTIQLVAVDTLTSVRTTLATSGSLSVGALAANGTKTFSVLADLLAGLTADGYTVQAIVTPVNHTAEFGGAFYTVLQNALKHTLNITVS